MNNANNLPTTGAASTNAGTGVGRATTTTTSTTAPGGNAPATGQTANPVKAGFAAVHGMGETVRGAFNSAVDGAFNESGGVTKNNAVTSAGIDEMETGQFSHATKNREGAIPGSDGEKRGL